MKQIQRTLAIVVMISTVLLTNRGIWLCLTDLNDPGSFCDYRFPGEELILYFFLSGFASWLLVQSGRSSRFVSRWKSNPILLVFVALAALSILWSVHPVSTLYHLLILVCSTVLAAFLGTYFSLDSWLRLLMTIGAVIVIASGLLSIFYPNAVIMEAPHEGSWRGLYWHKNFTGSLMAFWNAIFLLYGLHVFRTSRWKMATSVILYLLSLLFVFLSLSAAGIVIWFGLNASIIALLLWTRVKHRMTRQHYMLLGSAAFVLLILAIASRNLVFGLLGREPNLTGRLPLWDYLLRTAVAQRPLVGNGLSAIWDVVEFRRQVTSYLGWSFPITNGHNGFMDILLGLGLTGLALALLMLLVALYRTGKQFLAERTVPSLLPLLLVEYFVFANLSISFYLGIESFHWVLLVAAIFISTPTNTSETELLR